MFFLDTTYRQTDDANSPPIYAPDLEWVHLALKLANLNKWMHDDKRAIENPTLGVLCLKNFLLFGVGIFIPNWRLFRAHAAAGVDTPRAHERAYMAGYFKIASTFFVIGGALFLFAQLATKYRERAMGGTRWDPASEVRRRIGIREKAILQLRTSGSMSLLTLNAAKRAALDDAFVVGPLYLARVCAVVGGLCGGWSVMWMIGWPEEWYLKSIFSLIYFMTSILIYFVLALVQ